MTTLPKKNLKQDNTASDKSRFKKITDVSSMRHTSSSLLTEAVNYWLSETLVVAYAMACVEIVLLRSNRANAIYREIVQAWGLPGCQNMLEAISPYMQNPAEVLIKQIREREKAENMAKLKADGYINDQYFNLKLWLQSNKYKQLSEQSDYQYMAKRINELILVGFNRNIDQDNKDWKVRPDTPLYLLVTVIGLRSAAEYHEIRIQDLMQIKVQVDGKLYDLDYKMPRNPSTRKERSIRSVLLKAFKHDGFVLRHDTKLLKDADQWYKCRVDPGTIEGYLDELASQNIYIERGRLQNDIAPCDEATGYPRKWRK